MLTINIELSDPDIVPELFIVRSFVGCADLPIATPSELLPPGALIVPKLLRILFTLVEPSFEYHTPYPSLAVAVIVP